MQNSVTDDTRTAQPKILVLGATGATGRLIVSQAVARGHDVTVLVRSAEKASDLESSSSETPATRRSCARRSKAGTPWSARSAHPRARSVR